VEKPVIKTEGYGIGKGLLHLEFGRKVSHIIASIHCLARLGKKHRYRSAFSNVCAVTEVPSDFRAANMCNGLWKCKCCPSPYKLVANSSLLCTPLFEMCCPAGRLAVCMCVCSTYMLVYVHLAMGNKDLNTVQSKFSVTAVKRLMFLVSHSIYFLTSMGKISKQDCLELLMDIHY